MATAEQMKQYEEVLKTHTPALNKPVTEIVIFRTKEEITEETRTALERDFVGPSSRGKGVRATAWGYALDDPRTFVIAFDWEKIQYHWDFWQTPEFATVMGAIDKWFVPGRPLVRHYDFNPPGLLKSKFVSISIWDEGEEKDVKEIKSKVNSEQQGWEARQAGFAADMGEMTWCAVVLGYGSEEAARADGIQPKGVTHLVQLKRA
ncbi:uncharacterized protein AB675_1788 [Cyphellophora attinorum]|uniref:ABM domain-containing protein n=1 Tax=Cyphellophora attinorum TaxID=1664694 RepID=A0A0N1HDM7_9EURO|nr:uncharacterized protein AB675_1788 [Phialophora attinorum]KPI43134.1 hypothetical protein AB675_1788 [Phialophora attinorum]